VTATYPTTNWIILFNRIVKYSATTTSERLYSRQQRHFPGGYPARENRVVSGAIEEEGFVALRKYCRSFVVTIVGSGRVEVAGCLRWWLVCPSSTLTATAVGYLHAQLYTFPLFWSILLRASSSISSVEPSSFLSIIAIAKFLFDDDGLVPCSVELSRQLPVVYSLAPTTGFPTSPQSVLLVQSIESSSVPHYSQLPIDGRAWLTLHTNTLSTRKPIK